MAAQYHSRVWKEEGDGFKEALDMYHSLSHPLKLDTISFEYSVLIHLR